MERSAIISKIGPRVGILGLVAILGIETLMSANVTEAVVAICDTMDRVMGEAKQIHPENRVKALIYFRFVMAGLMGCPDLTTCVRLHDGLQVETEDIVFSLD